MKFLIKVMEGRICVTPLSVFSIRNERRSGKWGRKVDSWIGHGFTETRRGSKVHQIPRVGIILISSNWIETRLCLFFMCSVSIPSITFTILKLNITYQSFPNKSPERLFRKQVFVFSFFNTNNCTGALIRKNFLTYDFKGVGLTRAPFSDYSQTRSILNR